MGVRYHLLVLDGAHRGERFPLEGGRFTIGRKEKNDLVLLESTVSGFHVQIALEGEALILRDLGSTNGTLLDGRRIDEVPLAHGDTFSVGAIRIRMVDAEGGPLAEESQEVQVARVDQERLTRAGRRRPVLPLVIVLLVVAGVGGWALLTSEGPSLGPRRASLALVVPGNLLAGPVASMEAAGAGGWLLDPGSVSFFLDTTEAHTGESSAAAELEQGGVAHLLLKEPVAVSPGVLLEAAVFCRVTRPEVRSVLHLSYLEKGSRREVLRHASHWAESGQAPEARFQRLTVQGQVPPGCDAVRLAVVALGPAGRVVVDDFALTVQPTPSGEPESGMQVPGAPSANFARAGAALAVFQGQGARILSLQPVLALGERLRPRDLELARLCFASAGPDRLHLVHPSGGQVELEALFQVLEDSVSVSWKSTGDPGPAQFWITWVLPPEVDAAEIPARGGQGVGGLKLKTPQDMVALSWPRPVPYQMHAAEGEQRRSLLLLGADPLKIQVAFGKDQKVAMELIRSAEQARSQGRHGEAMALVRKLLEEVPFDEQSVTQGRALLGRLLEQGQNGLRELRERAERAFVFAAPSELEALVASASDLAAQFSGEESLVAEVTTLKNRAEALLEDYYRKERARELERLRTLQTALGEDAPALQSFVDECIERLKGQNGGAPEGGQDDAGTTDPAPGK